MAIRSQMQLFFDRSFAEFKASGKLMIYGRPKLMWENAPTPEDFFKGYGFSEVHTLDVSPYEGCSHIHDLNSSEPPAGLIGQYDVVMTAGTIEHVFHIGNALQTTAALVKEGGWVFFGAPVNNWVDHGFYQLSPTLKFDFFSENGFEFGKSRAAVHQGASRWSFPLYPGEGQILNNCHGHTGHQLRAQKVAGATYDRVPLQSLYRDKHDGARRRYRFKATEPFEAHDDELSLPPMARFKLAELRPLDGRYAARFQSPSHPPSLDRRPFRSPALVYENGELLPWIVSDAAMVKERPGSFFHGPGFIHFSTTDGTDPRSNSRLYEVAFPDMKTFLAPVKMRAPRTARTEAGGQPAEFDA